MSASPLITVITPTFNRGYIIKSAIDSVLGQTYKNFEYIIIDDNSTDNTKDIITSYKDRRIRYVRNSHTKGPSGARNTGLNLAQGNWITYIDDDDEWYPNLLEVMIHHIQANPSTVFAIPRGKKTRELYKNGVLIKQEDNSSNYPDTITIQDILYKTYHFDNIGFFHLKEIINIGIYFDEDKRVGALEDWEFALQICEKYPTGLLSIKESLFHYHQRYGTDGRVSNDTYKNTAIAYEYIYQKHKSHPLLKGQRWYPDRVIKYTKLHNDYLLGKAPPKYLLPFQ